MGYKVGGKLGKFCIIIILIFNDCSFKKIAMVASKKVVWISLPNMHEKDEMCDDDVDGEKNIFVADYGAFYQM